LDFVHPALLLFSIHVFFKGFFNHENLRVPPPNLPCPAWKKTRAFLIRPTRPLQESMQVVGFFHPFMARPAISERATKNRGWIPMALPRMQGSPDMLNSVVGKSGSDTWKIRLSTVTYGKSLTGGVGKS